MLKSTSQHLSTSKILMDATRKNEIMDQCTPWMRFGTAVIWGFRVPDPFPDPSMAGRPDRMSVLKLYKTLLRESSKFPAYNFRMYYLRRTRDGFRMNKTLTDPSSVQKVFTEGQSLLEVIKRQAIVYTLYKTDNLVIENEKK